MEGTFNCLWEVLVFVCESCFRNNYYTVWVLELVQFGDVIMV